MKSGSVWGIPLRRGLGCPMCTPAGSAQPPERECSEQRPRRTESRPGTAPTTHRCRAPMAVWKSTTGAPSCKRVHAMRTPDLERSNSGLARDKGTLKKEWECVGPRTPRIARRALACGLPCGSSAVGRRLANEPFCRHIGVSRPLVCRCPTNLTSSDVAVCNRFGEIKPLANGS